MAVAALELTPRRAVLSQSLDELGQAKRLIANEGMRKMRSGEPRVQRDQKRAIQPASCVRGWYDEDA